MLDRAEVNIMNSLPIAKFLYSDKSRSLNALVHKNTGCIVFLKVPQHIVYAPTPRTSAECFSYNIIGLYKLYKDYSLHFIDKIFMDCMMPTPSYKDATHSKEDVQKLKLDKKKCIKHYDFITKTARHVLTHGIFSIAETVDKNGYIDPKEKELQFKFRTVIKKPFPETVEDWEKLANYICEEADFFYDWLNRWAELWTDSDPNWKTMFDCFYDGVTLDNGRECSIIPDRIIDPKSNSCYPFNPDSSRESYTDFANGFSIQFLLDAINDMARYYPDKESKPNSQKYIWKSKEPTKNVKVLYQEMNLYVVDQVRSVLKSPDSRDNSYHDYYQTLYSAMISYISAMPTAKFVPKNICGSHFSRHR